METRFLKRWLGAVVLASGLVAAATNAAPAVADGIQPCTSWSATITSVVATGPGTAVVSGRATTQAANPAEACVYDARLRGYAREWETPRVWNVTDVTGEVSLSPKWRNGDTYSTEIGLGVGTNVVCIRTPNALGLVCWEANVYAEADGSPSTPDIGVQVQPRTRPPGDGGTDICGNCV